MSTVASLLVSLKTDFGDTARKVDDLNKGFEKAGDSASEAGHKIDDLGEHSHHAGHEAEDLTDKFKDLIKELSKIALEVVEIGGVFETLKESMVIAAEIESTTVAIGQFTGSVEKAGEVIEQMERLAKNEALAFPEVLPAAQHFMALGFSAEETVPALAAAGNAAWALGTSIESVSQRMGMMAMGGMVSGRFLRTLGINLEDLARTMGITGKDTVDLEDKVRKAFKGMDEEDRIGALTLAMGKFGDLGAKEADTLTGKWILMKNAFHEMFLALGQDLSGMGSTLETVGTKLANTMQYALSNSMVDMRNNLRDLGLLHSTYEKHEGTGPESSVPTPDADKIKEGAAKAQAAAEASQEYNRQKIAIDSASTHYRAMLELQRNYWKSQESAGQLGHTALINLEKSFNQAELQDTLAAIAKKKSLQTSTKGLKEEEKDATLDAQALKARDDYAAKEAALDNKEVDRAQKAIATAEKFGAERIKKVKDQYEKMLHELEAFAFENQDFNKKIADDEMKTRTEAEQLAEKTSISGAHDTASRGGQSVRASQLALERTYGLEYMHTLAQQVAYQRELGALAAKSLDIRAEELAVIAKQSHLDADRIAATAADTKKDDDIRAAADAALKAHADDLKVEEAHNAALNSRYETTTKLLDLQHQQSILGQLATQFASGGESIPAALGSAIAGGLTHQGRGGMDIGKEITNALRNVGRDLFGDVLAATMKQMIESLGLNTLAQNIMHILFGTSNAVTAANTTATVAQTAVMGGLFGRLLAALGIHHKVATAGSAPNPAAAHQAQLDLDRDIAQLDRDILNLNQTDGTLTTAVDNLIAALNKLIAQMQQCGCGGQDNGAHGGGGGTSGGLVAGVGAAAAVVGAALASIFGGASGGGEATGNFHSADVAHLIGENGPELFRPSESGTVVPNSALGGGRQHNGDNHITINESVNARDTAREVASVLKQLDPAHAASAVPYSS